MNIYSGFPSYSLRLLKCNNSLCTRFICRRRSQIVSSLCICSVWISDSRRESFGEEDDTLRLEFTLVMKEDNQKEMKTTLRRTDQNCRHYLINCHP